MWYLSITYLSAKICWLSNHWAGRVWVTGENSLWRSVQSKFDICTFLCRCRESIFFSLFRLAPFNI